MPIEQYLVQLIHPLLAHPTSLVVAQSNDEMGVLFTVTVHAEDMGPLIGKNGETAKAVRHLVRVAGVKQNARVSVKITEPDGTAYRPRPKALGELTDSRI